MKRHFAMAALASLVFVSGCASITTGQNQPLTVETMPCRMATCRLSNDKGTWYVSATPGTVTVQRAYGDMTIICEKDEFKSNPTLVASATKGMAFGNILVGGIIGIAVDAGTGAAYDYPPVISVPMICTGDPKLVVQPIPPPPLSVQAKSPSGESPSAPSLTPALMTTTVPATVAGTNSPAQQPMPPVATKPSAPPSDSKYLYSAEQFAKSGGCATPVATMNIRTAVAESFTVTCSNAEAMSIRCENGVCRALQ